MSQRRAHNFIQFNDFSPRSHGVVGNSPYVLSQDLLPQVAAQRMHDSSQLYKE